MLVSPPVARVILSAAVAAVPGVVAIVAGCAAAIFVAS
jgi:hypothetical protein